MSNIAELLTEAKTTHRAGNLLRAEELYRRVLAADPTEVEALYLHGAACQALGRLDEALGSLQQAVALAPGHVDAHNFLGVTLAQAGKTDEAVETFRWVLQLKPDFANAQQNLHQVLATQENARGLVLAEQGSLEEAIACYRRALELKPDYPHAHGNLGNAFKTQGKLDQAAACYQRVLELQPDYVEAHNNLGAVLVDQGRPDEAIACYRRVVQLKPDYAAAYANMGVALKGQAKWEEAAACFRRALELQPDLVEAHQNMGGILHEQGNTEEAAACYRRAVALRPDSAVANYGLATALQAQQKLDEAAACFRQAIELKPDFAEAHHNLGIIAQDHGDLAEAAARFRRALELRPELGDAYTGLGIALQGQGELEEAAACFEQALQLKPDSVEAHWNRSLLYLLTGDFDRGWTQYEWRWQTKVAVRRQFSEPAWDGQSLEGQTILLHAEQGLGDAFQFVRYVPLVKQRGAAVILECHQSLLSLLASCAGVDQLVGKGGQLPPFDVQAPLLSMPRLFGTTLENIPANVPYLFAKPALVEQWREKLRTLAGFKIGVGWQGNPKFAADRQRSFRLAQLAPLADVPSVQLVSLQKGRGVEQLTEADRQFPIADFSAELDETAGPFMDTAAVMRNLDLVVTSDTALAHLAGALGVPVWVPLPFVPDWRWLLDRSDSPWYPTMRLFRQQHIGDWPGVFAAIQAALRERLRTEDRLNP